LLCVSAAILHHVRCDYAAFRGAKVENNRLTFDYVCVKNTKIAVVRSHEATLRNFVEIFGRILQNKYYIRKQNQLNIFDMANKRNFKKAVKAACGSIAGECVISRNLIPGIDADKMNDIVLNIADLQYTILTNASFSFDKGKRAFADIHEYKVARQKYFHKAFAKLVADFNNGLEEVVNQMNAALPEAQKEANKAAAK
jgi:hypothetical protein